MTDTNDATDSGEDDHVVPPSKSVYLASAWLYIFPILYFVYLVVSGNQSQITNPAVLNSLLTFVGFHMAVGFTEYMMYRSGING